MQILTAIIMAFLTLLWLLCKLYEIIDKDIKIKNFKREIKYNPNCYKSYSFLNTDLILTNKKKYTQANNIKNYLNKKIKKDEKDDVIYRSKSNVMLNHRNKIINENLNNNLQNEILRSADSTSIESVEKNKDGNDKNSKEKIGVSQDIIDELFSGL